MTDTNTLAVMFGLLAALAWGSGDFSGGLAARKSSAFGAVAASQGLGLIVLVAVVALSGEPFPDLSDIVWAALAGLAGGLALSGFYQSMRLGKIGIVTPVSGVVATASPVVVAALAEGLPSVLTLTGFVLAVTGIILVTQDKQDNEVSGDSPAWLGIAIIAGLGFGAFYILFDQISDDTLFWPILAARLASLSLVGTITGFRRETIPGRNVLHLIALSGLLDVGGNIFYLRATQLGRLDTAAVLGSLYAGVATFWATVLLREQVRLIQWGGVVLILGAIVLITMG